MKLKHTRGKLPYRSYIGRWKMNGETHHLGLDSKVAERVIEQGGKLAGGEFPPVQFDDICDTYRIFKRTVYIPVWRRN